MKSLSFFVSHLVDMILTHCPKQGALLLLTFKKFSHDKTKEKNGYLNCKVFFSQDDNHFNWCKGRTAFLVFHCCPHCVLRKKKTMRNSMAEEGGTINNHFLCLK